MVSWPVAFLLSSGRPDVVTIVRLHIFYKDFLARRTKTAVLAG